MLLYSKSQYVYIFHDFENQYKVNMDHWNAFIDNLSIGLQTIDY